MEIQYLEKIQNWFSVEGSLHWVIVSFMDPEDQLTTSHLPL